MGIAWKDMQKEPDKGIKKEEYYFPTPKMGDHPYYYAKIKDKGGEPYIESVKYETVQFRLRWYDSASDGHRSYTLEWTSNDGQKYAYGVGITLTAMNYGPLSDPHELALFLANSFRHGMETADRPDPEIQCMYDFLGKVVWGETQSSAGFVSDLYNYYPGPAPKYAKGGFKIGSHDMYVNDYAIYDEAFTNNYRQPEVDILPGVKEVVKHPVSGADGTIQSIIISLNDIYEWTRDQIADWLETLDADLTFKERPVKLDKPDDEDIKFADLDKSGYHKGEKIEYKPTKVTQITPNTVSIQFDASKIDTKTLEIMFGGAISTENLDKIIGGIE